MAFPDGWQHLAAITIHADKVAGTAGLTGFPVLLTAANLLSEMFDADGPNPAQDGGGDIRFSADMAGLNQLPIEIVHFTPDINPLNGAAIIWVKVPALSASTDTVIHVWWGKGGESQPAATAPFGRNAVWSGYGMAAHLNDAASFIDSTGNNGPGVVVNGTINAAAGPAGLPAIQTGPGKIEWPANASINGLPQYYASFWVRWISGEDNFFIGGLNGRSTSSGNFLRIDGSGAEATRPSLQIGIDGESNPVIADFFAPSGGWIDGAWYFVTIGHDGLSYQVTVNGGGRTHSVPAGRWPGNTETGIVLGARREEELADGVQGLALLRIRDGIPSDDWIATEYNNQSRPETFAAAGAGQNVGGIPAIAVFSNSLLSHGIAISSAKDFFSGAAAVCSHETNNVTPWDLINVASANHGHHIGQTAAGGTLTPSHAHSGHGLAVFSGQDRLTPPLSRLVHFLDAWGLPAPASPNKRIIHPHRHTTARIARAGRRHGVTGA